MKPFVALPLAAGLLALSACGGDSQSAADRGKAPDPDEVVARVNGQPISAVALDAQVQALSARGQAVQRSQALNELVDLRLLAQIADEQGLSAQPEIAAKIERQRAALLAQHLVRAELSDFEVTEKDLRQAYDEQVAGTSGREYRAGHVLLETKDEAASIIAQLDEGADFAKLAEEHSTGPTASRGGDLGWFQPDQMVKPFADAVQGLEAGGHTAEPVQTEFGWHVIRLAEVREVQQPKFEDMKSKLRNQLVSRHIQEYVRSLREEAEIEIADSSVETAAAQELPAAASDEAARADASSK